MKSSVCHKISLTLAKVPDDIALIGEVWREIYIILFIILFLNIKSILFKLQYIGKQANHLKEVCNDFMINF